jgi:hypothetical protein
VPAGSARWRILAEPDLLASPFLGLVRADRVGYGREAG